MNSKHYERIWNAIRGLRERYKTFEAALGHQQAHALYRAAASLVDAERRLLSVYYQEQTREHPPADDMNSAAAEQLVKVVSGVASVNDSLLAAVFIAAESDITADERARTLMQRAIDEHRRVIRELMAAWDKAPRPR